MIKMAAITSNVTLRAVKCSILFSHAKGKKSKKQIFEKIKQPGPFADSSSVMGPRDSPIRPIAPPSVTNAQARLSWSIRSEQIEIIHMIMPAMSIANPRQ